MFLGASNEALCADIGLWGDLGEFRGDFFASFYSYDFAMKSPFGFILQGCWVFIGPCFENTSSDAPNGLHCLFLDHPPINGILLIATALNPEPP